MSVPRPRGRASSARRACSTSRSGSTTSTERDRGFSFRNQQPVLRGVRLVARGRTPKPDQARRARHARAVADRRAAARRPAHFGDGYVDTAVYDGAALGVGAEVHGPALVEEPFTVLVVPPGARARVDEAGQLRARTLAWRPGQRFFTAEEYAVVAAALRPAHPADGRAPGGGALGCADYIDGLLDAFAFDPPRIWAGGPFSGRAGGDAGFEQLPGSEPRRGAGVAHPHRGLAGPPRARVQRPRPRLAGRVPRRAARPRRRLRRRSIRRGARRPPRRGARRSAAAVPPRLRGRVRRARVRRQPRPVAAGPRSATPATCSPRATPTTRSAGRA